MLNYKNKVYAYLQRERSVSYAFKSESVFWYLSFPLKWK